MEIVLSTKNNSRNKEQKYLNQLWRRLNKQRLRNEKLQIELDKLVQVYQQKVLPVQIEKVLPSIIMLAERLTVLLSRKSIPQWQRRDLCGWICELIDEAGTFDGSKAEQLILKYDTTVAALNGMTLEEMIENHRMMEEEMEKLYADDQDEEGFDLENEKNPYEDRVHKHVESLKSKARDARNSPNVDMFGFDDVDDIIDHTEEQLRAAAKKIFGDIDNDEIFDEFEEFEGFDETSWDPEFQPDAAIKIDQQWLRKLFRRTARVLHPDRDTNPENAQKLHEAMTDLLRARKNLDVVTMISLYAEHVGGGDLDIASADMEHITRLLEMQEDELEEKYHQCINQSPIHAQVYETLYAATRNGRVKKLKQCLQSFRKEAKEMQELAGNLRTLANLKSALIHRDNDRRSMFKMDFGEYF